MASIEKCQQCGVELGPHVAEGICPACALRAALLPGTNGHTEINPDEPEETVSHPFGDYELLGEIGHGGMGVVYRARHKRLQRFVALKLIRAGRLASAAEVKRFEQEARAAANLQHPNIVAVHEVGEYEGQPYYTMDLVEGQNLGELVKQQPLPAKQAAQYLKVIANAMHFAHEHQTLHRDLKPTNILIDRNDQPRITDFGLARCEYADSHQTVTGQLLGTPTFMSPEQAQGKTGVIGPQSDIYSAGAVLYYLLTQRPPFTAESLPALLELVVHHEPISPRDLNPSVPRDLETICLKCLQKDPAHRFHSALELSDELDRFYMGKPILSRPITKIERTCRWCGRNRAIASTLAALLFVLLAGVGASTWLALRASNEAAKSRQVAQFLRDMIKGVGPSVALGRDTKLLREILDKAADRIGKELKSQPVVEAELRATIGDVYLELGEFNQAEAMYSEALKLTKTNYGEEHPETASALDNMSNILYRQGKFTEAVAMERKVLTMRIKTLGQAQPQVAKSLINLAAFLQAEGKLAEAENIGRQALIANRKLYGNEHEHVIEALNNLGCVLCLEGRSEEAEAIIREALAIERKLHGNDNPKVATMLNNLGKILADESKFSEAETTFRESLMMREKILGDEHPDAAQTLDSLAGILQDRGNLMEAEKMYRRALDIRKKALGNEHPYVALSLNNLADLLDDEGKTADAEAMQLEALAMQRKLLGSEHPDVARSLNNLAGLFWSENKLSEAEIMLREALATRRKLFGNDHPDVAASLEQLGGLLHDEDKIEEAEKLLRECLSIREKISPNDWRTFITRSVLGGILSSLKQYAEAEPLLLSGFNGLNELKVKLSAANKLRLRKAVERLIGLYEGTLQPNKATEWKIKLQELDKPTAKEPAEPLIIPNEQ